MNTIKRDGANEIIIYETPNKEVRIDVRLEKETIWLNLNQIAVLFDIDKSGVSRHISNIYKTAELEKGATVAKIATVQNEGNRSLKRSIDYFNLDMILSIGYRVNSEKATKFRV